jgi:hypothetical protein
MDFVKPALNMIFILSTLTGCMGSRLPRDLGHVDVAPPMAPATSAAATGPTSTSPTATGGPGAAPATFPTLQGLLVTSEGAPLDLSTLSPAMPTLLIFSGELCDSCRAETPRLRAMAGPQAPRNVRVVTVLVGSGTQVAAQWKNDFNLPWTVAADESAETFVHYCPNFKTPCTLLFDPARGGIIFHKYGAVEPTQLMELTGPWENPTP